MPSSIKALNMKTLLSVVIWFAVLTIPTVGYTTSTPTETAKGVIVTVLKIINDPAFLQSHMAAERRKAIEQVIVRSVNYEVIARHLLGKSWINLEKSDRQYFIRLFVQVLRDAIACRFNHYSTTKVLYLSEQQNGRTAVVHTLFYGDKMETRIDLRMVKRSGKWLLYDAVVDGVSFVDNYRAQVRYVLQTMSYARLIGRMEVSAFVPKTFERITP
jgi:phospholipid transport system substrate-binding protein